jgi:hypothetical protein
MPFRHLNHLKDWSAYPSSAYVFHKIPSVWRRGVFLNFLENHKIVKIILKVSSIANSRAADTLNFLPVYFCPFIFARLFLPFLFFFALISPYFALFALFLPFFVENLCALFILCPPTFKVCRRPWIRAYWIRTWKSFPITADPILSLARITIP